MLERHFESDFKIKYDGQSHQIDANVFVNSLIHMSSAIQEIARLHDSNSKLEVKIKALEKGSFLCHISLVEVGSILGKIFASENVATAAGIVSTLVGLIELKKFLKGKKEKEAKKLESEVEITNENGDKLIVNNFVFHVYDKSPVVNEALAKNFGVINDDLAISAFELTDRNEQTYVRVEKTEFQHIIRRVEELSEDERNVSEKTSLHIIRLSFEEGLKWDFYHRGVKISARVTDPTFQERIDNGQAFSKGDLLEVELQSTQKFEPSVNTFVTKSNQVLRIYRHVLRNEQQALNFTRDE